ncbi:hypothetical protein B0I37DRAFT_431340 [Chaetomium sp. MPI-CAGE-AT-0009]|nr:hypothetical protein B0I37DRAFT_431340 [Chaetomium sp. MPI-CAGE-AT-0009]
MSSPSVLRTAAVVLNLLILPVIRAQDSSPNGPTFENIAPNCNAYHTVVEGDGCWSISQAYHITLDQFYEWNPDIADDCGTNFWPGYAYCVGVGPAPPSSLSSTPATCSCSTSSTSASSSHSTSPTQTASETPSISTSSNTEPYSTLHPITNYTITPTTTLQEFPPSKTQDGQPADCDDWRLTTAWDTCDSIVASSSWLTMANLLAWNPALGADCSGLYDGWWVCISVRPASNIDIGWTTTAGNVEIPTITANYTPTTFSPVDASFTASPTLEGLVSGCKSFYQAKAGDTCRAMVDGTLLTESDFFAWNPALNGNCNGLWENYWYCVVGPEGITAMPPTVTATPAPLPPNQIGTCKRWYQRDGESCAEISAMFGTFSEQEFISWNSNVGSACTNLVDGWWYCVGIPGTPTTRSEPVQTTDIPDATPTQDGMTADCARLWLVGPADTCESIEEANGITEEQFLEWNPALGTTSCVLTRDFYVCVSVDGPAVTITSGPSSTSGTATSSPGTGITTLPGSSTTSAATTTTATAGNEPITTPTPTRDGMTSECRRFYFARENDGCWAIANAAGIDLK